jgi:hypothetical protein
MDYFKKIDSPEVQKGSVKAVLTARKKNQAFEIGFVLEGTVLIPATVVSTTWSSPSAIRKKLQVKFGDKFSEEDEIVIVPESEGAINVAWFLYEFILLNIPLKHVHARANAIKQWSIN